MKQECKEKEKYVSPLIEIISVQVEKGFCESYGPDPTPWCAPCNSPWKNL